MILSEYIKKCVDEAKVNGLKELNLDIGIEELGGVMYVNDKSTNRLKLKVQHKQ